MNDVDPSDCPEVPRSRCPSDGSKDREGAARVQLNVAQGGSVEKGMGSGGEVMPDGDIEHASEARL